MVGNRTRKGSGVGEEVRRTPEQPLVQAAASDSGAAQDGGSAPADTRTPLGTIRKRSILIISHIMLFDIDRAGHR